MGVSDVKAWLGRTGSFGWGKEDVELHLTAVLPRMGSRDILGAHFRSPTKSSQSDALLQVVHLQHIAIFHIYRTIRRPPKLVELLNSKRMMESRARQSRPSLAALHACVALKLQPCHLQTNSGVLRTTLKSLEPLLLCLSLVHCRISTEMII